MKNIGHKIAIIGASCSGKSTLATRLGEHVDLPVHHLDQVVWKPGYKQQDRPKADVDADLAAILAQPRWIVEGVYARLLPAQVAAADTVIFLDLSRTVCLLRYLRRTWRGPQLGLHTGDVSGFTWGMVKWILRDFPKKRPQIEAALAQAPQKLVRITSAGQIKDLLC